MSNILLIKLDDVSLTYNGTDVLRNINLAIYSDQWIAIVGNNGSGKTTLLKAILGIIKSRRGDVSINKEILGDSNQFVGYMPQEKVDILSDQISSKTILINSLDPMNINNYSEAQKYKILMDIARQVHIEQFFSKPLSELSGGQKKRIYLAQALLNKPRLLILDEPFANLDSDSKKSFMSILKDLSVAYSLSVVMVSHDLKDISNYFNCFIHLSNMTNHVCKNNKCMRESHVII